MSGGPRNSAPQMNGNGGGRRPGTGGPGHGGGNNGGNSVGLSRSNSSCGSQHDDLIKYVRESWSKVAQDLDKPNTVYYSQRPLAALEDFEPFDLEAFWGRRVMRNWHHHT